METLAQIMLDASTGNILLAGALAFQAWIVRELYQIKAEIATMRQKLTDLPCGEAAVKCE